jgi:TonB-dependent SusC/RagA subfamily outer membrane receptor
MRTGNRLPGWHAMWVSVVMLLLVAGCASSERGVGETGEVDPFNTVSAEDIADDPSSSVHELIQGRIPGVDVYEKAGGIAIRIRGASSFLGSNEPLYVLDGFPTEPGPGNVFHVNPYDVASIRVLKGVQAAAYGVRGANGVIVITTKRGGGR